jgi:hypothetical protein
MSVELRRIDVDQKVFEVFMSLDSILLFIDGLIKLAVVPID